MVPGIPGALHQSRFPDPDGPNTINTSGAISVWWSFDVLHLLAQFSISDLIQALLQ